MMMSLSGKPSHSLSSVTSICGEIERGVVWWDDTWKVKRKTGTARGSVKTTASVDFAMSRSAYCTQNVNIKGWQQYGDLRTDRLNQNREEGRKVSIYQEARRRHGGLLNPFAPGPSIQFEPWEGVVPPPSVTELLEQLAGDDLSITQAWRMFDAEQTLRKISARDDTGPLPIIVINKEEKEERE